MERSTRCIGCGAPVPDLNGPVHAYITSAPGCWQQFGEVLAGESSDPARRHAHELTVDTYAVQHPTNPDRRNRNSVALHLISLCLLLERDLPVERAPELRAAHARRHRSSGFPWMEPPSARGALTVADVIVATTAEEHLRRVEQWADSAWSAWAEHHDQIRAWSAEIPLYDG